MDIKPLYPLSLALSKLIKLEDLISEIGTKALTDLKTINNYLAETHREDLMAELLSKEEGWFVINDDELINDHLLVALKSPQFENENNLLFFLMPSVRTYKIETEKFINELKEIITLPSDKDKFYNDYEICFLKCEIMKIIKTVSATKNSIN